MAETNKIITFTDTSTENPTSFDWDFGDNTKIIGTNQKIVTHIYTLPGDYIIKHKPYNSCGAGNECIKNLIVTDSTTCIQASLIMII